MQIRIDDIPLEGKEVTFQLDTESLNARVAPDLGKKAKKAGPDYAFKEPVDIKLQLKAKGMTITLLGSVSGAFSASCARCGDEVSKKIVVPIDMYLKPRKASSTTGAEDEDVGYGFHDGEYVDCNEISEELLMLALPMIVRCEGGSNCAIAAEKNNWVFGDELSEDDEGDERLKVLRSLKIH